MKILKISKNVPLVPIERARKRRKYPFEQMDIGDMLFVPGHGRISTYVSVISRNIGRKFKTRRLYMRQLRSGVWRPCTADTRGAVFGTGVWRIE